MIEYVNLAFDQLGFPHEDENPNDIQHIAEYLESPDTQSAQDILSKYPVLFKDPVVLNVINLCRTFLINPPDELTPDTHKHPAYPATTDVASSASHATHAESNPIFGSLLSASHASSADPTSPTLTDQKLITILASVADGSLTSLQYDFKTHQNVVLTPNIDQRISAIKLLAELASKTTTQATQAVQIINDINIPSASPITPTSSTTPASSTTTTLHDTHTPASPVSPVSLEDDDTYLDDEEV